MLSPRQPPGVAVPSSYTPELRNRCLQAVVVNYYATAPGVMFYFFKHDPDNPKCKDRTKEQRAQDVAGFMADASEIIKFRYAETRERYRLAQEYVEGNHEGIMQTLVDIYDGQGFLQKVSKNAPCGTRFGRPWNG